MKKIVKTKQIPVIKPAAKKFNLQAFFYILNQPIVIFGLTLVLGIIIAFSLGFWYSSVKDKIFAEDTLRDTLTYQGKIVNADGVPPADGLYNMRFEIYNQDTNGLLLWTETWDGTNQGVASSKVQVNSGVFTVELNSLCGNWVGACASNGGVTFSTANFYLQVELDFDGDGVVYEETFLPRKRFTATPFSMNADKLDGRDAIDFLLKSGGEDAILGSITVSQILDNSLVTFLQFANYTSPGAYYLTNDSGPNNLAAKTFYTAPSEGFLPLNGTDFYGQIDDVDDLTFGTGTLDTPFSISAWIQPVDATNFIIASKGIYNTNAEYKFYIDENDKVSLQLFDESVDNAYIGRMYNAETMDGYQADWIQLTATYNGNGGSDGIKLYFNGLPVDDADRESGSYIAMENLTADLHIGRYNSAYANGRIDDFMIFNRALSPAEVQSLYSGSQYKTNLNATQTKTMYLVLTGIDGANFENSNMYYDAISNQIILDQKMFIPDNMPAIDNAQNDRDYTHFTDENKILAYDFSTPLTGITDLEGNSDGTYNADNPFVNAGFLGYGFSLDHAGDYITFADPGVSVTNGSIEMWARLNNIASSETNYLAYFSAASSSSLELVKQGTSDLYAKVGDATLSDTGFDIPDTNWHHYAVTYNSGNYEVFVDGVSVATGSYTSPITSPTTLLLGYGNTGNTSLNGYLDSVAIYNDVLSDQEILNHAKSSFDTLYINDKIADGLTETTLGNLLTLPETLNKQNVNDPVYFQYTGTKKLSLGFSEGFGLTTYSNDNNDIYATINGATWEKGFFGHGLNFDGVNDYLEIADTPYDDRLDMGTNDFAIEFWINGSELGNSGKKIISKRSGNTGYEIYYDSASDSLKFFIGDGTNTVESSATGTDFSDGKWHHFLVSFDFGGSASIFCDGSIFDMPVIDISSVTGSITSDTNLLIGKDSVGNYFNGKIDSIIFYDLTGEPQFNIYDSFGRHAKAPDSLFISGKNTSNALGTLSLMNQSGVGHAAVVGMRNINNTSGYPLAIWNDNTYQDVNTNNVYNLMWFGLTYISGNTEFGNLKWDSTNNRFHLSKGLAVTGDLVLSGELMGARGYIYGGMESALTGSSYATMGIGGTLLYSATMGDKAIRSGSITGLSATLDVTSESQQGDITIKAMVNNTEVYNLVIASNGVTQVSGYSTQARGTDSFVAGDLLQLYIDFTTFTGTITGLAIQEEFVYDN